MLLRDYTLPEINHFIANCNFTDSELQYFTLKSKDRSNVQISMEMNISEQQVSKLAKRVKNKINRV
jgi:DNA-binding CsgD family transcriptional regulator